MEALHFLKTGKFLMFAAHRTVPLILTTDAQLPQEEERSILALSMVKGIGFHHSPQPDRIPGQCRAVVWETHPVSCSIPGIYKHVLKAIRDADVFCYCRY